MKKSVHSTNITKIIISIMMIMFFIMTGCAGTKNISRLEVLNQVDSISQLDNQIQKAKNDEVNMYAPQSFKESTTLLDKAIATAQKGKSSQAIILAKQGQEVLNKARDEAAESKKQTWEIADYRKKAIKAGAPALFHDEFEKAEDLLRKTTGLIENGEIENSKKIHPELIDAYNKLEKDALEKGVVELAKIAFKQAKEAGAERYSPKYYQRAQKELDLALSILDADRTQTQKANEHGKLAARLAENATQISELVKMFKLRDFSNEDIVSWYWDQLNLINEPLETSLEFKEPNHIVIQSFQKKLLDLKTSKEAAQNDVKKLSADAQELAVKQQTYIEALKTDYRSEMDKILKKYKTQISDQQLLQAEKDRIEQEGKQKFKYIQSLFNADEARVYRQGDNLLISAQGFYFPSGKDEIQSTNYGLLNKILTTINQFPHCKIEVSGHTDSVGTAQLNQMLSENRAKNVAQFLMNLGTIEASRISSRGYGATKPVESNDTNEGRTKNRRIELMIING